MRDRWAVVALDTDRLHYGDLTLKASFHHTPATVRAAFALIASGRFKSERYLSQESSLRNVPALFAEMAAGSAVHASRGIKTVIQPEAL